MEIICASREMDTYLIYSQLHETSHFLHHELSIKWALAISSRHYYWVSTVVERAIKLPAVLLTYAQIVFSPWIQSVNWNSLRAGSLVAVDKLDASDTHIFHFRDDCHKGAKVMIQLFRWKFETYFKQITHLLVIWVI